MSLRTGDQYAVCCPNCKNHWASDVETPINTPCPICGHVGWPSRPGSNPITTCEWVQDSEEDHWATSCGQGFHVVEGVPSENLMRFCCFCGQPLVETPFVEHNDEEFRDEEI